jgi:hypothetical protein
MKITLEKLNAMQGALSKTLGAPIDFKLAYRLRKIAGTIVTELKAMEAARQDLIKKHGEKVKDTDQINVPPKNMEALKKDYKALLKIEVDLGIVKIPFECFDGVKISAFEMSTIEDLIEEPAAPKKK